MKKLMFLAVFVFGLVSGYAQTEKFTQAMLTNLEKAGNVKVLADYQELANSFERIAIAEKTQWTPYYYAALYNLIITFTDSFKVDKKKYIEAAQQNIKAGLTIKPDETELIVLEVMSYFGEMALEPMKGMELMPKSQELLEKAKALNGANPRIYLIQAEAVYNTPAQFGGGKDKALPILQTAKEKFRNSGVTDPLMPKWGIERCEQLLNECEGAK